MQGPSEQPRVPLGNVIFSGQVKGRRCSIHNNGPDYGGESIIITLCIWLHVPLLLIAAWTPGREAEKGRRQENETSDGFQQKCCSHIQGEAKKIILLLMIMMTMMKTLPLTESNW